MSEPSILVADANEGTGRALKRLIEKQYGYRVSLPQSFDQLKECLRSRVFDSAIIDLDLSRWGRLYRMNGHVIHNGRDLADFFMALYRGANVGLYGSEAAFKELRIDPKDTTYAASVTIPLPPSLGQIKATLAPVFRRSVLKSAPRVHKANPLFQPFLNGSPARREEHLRSYKRACGLNRYWLEFSFETVGDPSWSFVCDGSVEESFSGASLNGNRSKNAQPGVKGKKKYPRESETSEIGRRRKSNPYVFWNTREDRFLAKQFKTAGPGLTAVPSYLQDDFGIGTADPQAKAYLAGEREEVISRCKQLTKFGQLETASEILKLLYRYKPSWIKDFSVRCERAGLPLLIEIYKGRLESIEKDRQTGWVKLTIWDESRVPLMEPFDLKNLEQRGVKHEADLFEYTVYVPFVGGGSASRIEAVDSSDSTCFDGETRRVA